MIRHLLVKFDVRKLRHYRTQEKWECELPIKWTHTWRPLALVVYKGDDALLDSITCCETVQCLRAVSTPAFLFHYDHDFEYIRAALESGYAAYVVNQLPPITFPTMQPTDKLVIEGRGPLVAMALIISIVTEA